MAMSRESAIPLLRQYLEEECPPGRSQEFDAALRAIVRWIRVPLRDASVPVEDGDAITFTIGVPRDVDGDPEDPFHVLVAREYELAGGASGEEYLGMEALFADLRFAFPPSGVDMSAVVRGGGGAYAEEGLDELMHSAFVSALRGMPVARIELVRSLV